VRSVDPPLLQVGSEYGYRYCAWGWDTADGYPPTERCEPGELDADALIDVLRAASG
jgi:hypothetical protein